MNQLIIALLLLNVLSLLSCSESKTDNQSSKETNSFEQRPDSNTNNIIRSYQKRLVRHPNDHLSYAKLGEAYIQKGRETGNSDYYSKAEEALKEAIEIYPNSYAALVYLGQVSSFRHEFHKTIKYAKKAIESRPFEDSPFGILGDAYLELGMYDEAETAYEKMFSINPSFYSYSRMSHMKELKGDIDGAIDYMKKATNRGTKKRLPAENLAWAEVIIGSLYFNKGDLRNAENHYKNALSIADDYYLALEHLAEINAVQGNYDEAINLFKQVLQLNPKPEFYIALGEVYESIGDKKKAESLYDKTEKIFESYIAEGNYAHIREIALFYADDEEKFPKAIELAKKGLGYTRDIYAYDTLAWVYYKQGEFQEALDNVNASLRLGTNNALLFYHAGMINYKLNNKDKAKDYLTLALETNPYFDSNAVGEIREVLHQLDNAGLSNPGGT